MSDIASRHGRTPAFTTEAEAFRNGFVQFRIYLARGRFLSPKRGSALIPVSDVARWLRLIENDAADTTESAAAFAIPAAPARTVFRIEASTTDPSLRRDNPVQDDLLADAREVRARALHFLRCGYWVEVFDDESRELLAGPFDPDQPLPGFVV